MDTNPLTHLHREHFLRDSGHPTQIASEKAILRLLIGQDGSTTRLLESLAGDRISVHVFEQEIVHKLPRGMASCLPGKSFLRRITALQAEGHVLLDSLSYTAIEAMPESVMRKLQEGVTPIGHVLSRLCTLRRFRSQDIDLFEDLWRAVGCPDPDASRSSCIYTPRGPCMILGETFRRGVLDLRPSIDRPT